MTETTADEKFEGLVRIYMDCGASESLARETAHKFREELRAAIDKEITSARPSHIKI